MSRGPISPSQVHLALQGLNLPKLIVYTKIKGLFQKLHRNPQLYIFTFDIECKTCYYIIEEFHVLPL